MRTAEVVSHRVVATVLIPGDHICAHSLLSTELNGLRGTVLVPENERGRIRVRLHLKDGSVSQLYLVLAAHKTICRGLYYAHAPPVYAF